VYILELYLKKRSFAHSSSCFYTGECYNKRVKIVMVDISPVSPKYINFITNLEYEFCTTK
jgi:hypothetical protein